MYKIKSHAKVNIFLKITGHNGEYHTLLSRFVKVKSLYDEIEFVPCECDSFTIEGCGDIDIKSNTIYKAYKSLNEYTGDLDILNFFYNHKVVVKKNIPQKAGLGGGSSNAGAFLRLVRDVCNILISDDELAKVGATIGADVPFFVYDYNSANVSGFGEVVEKFDEDSLDIKIFTPPIECDTAVVYKSFKENFLEDITLCSFLGWERLKSKEILELINDPFTLNDLFLSSVKEYPKLREYVRDDYYFSGSGSSFFSLT